jgi:hypothetical protein
VLGRRLGKNKCARWNLVSPIQLVYHLLEAVFADCVNRNQCFGYVIGDCLCDFCVSGMFLNVKLWNRFVVASCCRHNSEVLFAKHLHLVDIRLPVAEILPSLKMRPSLAPNRLLVGTSSTYVSESHTLHQHVTARSMRIGQHEHAMQRVREPTCDWSASSVLVQRE